MKTLISFIFVSAIAAIYWYVDCLAGGDGEITFELAFFAAMIAVRCDLEAFFGWNNKDKAP